MTGPIMTIGKNLAGLALLKDRTPLITRLMPRGSGSAPSELTLNNPSFWPSFQVLDYQGDDSVYSYFHLPKINGQFEYSVYDGFVWSGQPLPSGFYVGGGIDTAYNLPLVYTGSDPEPVPKSWFIGSLGSPNDAVAEVFHAPNPWRPVSVSLNLQRQISSTPTEWTTQPRFVVGIYSTSPSQNLPNVIQQAGYYVPYQGPLVWCYGNLLSISTTPTWYTFLLQTAQLPAGWYAVVVAPYPTSNTQWSVNDYLEINGSSSRVGVATNCYGLQSRVGNTQKSWMMAASGSTVEPPYTWQYAFQLTYIDTDLTSKFYQAYSAYPGRGVKCAISTYAPWKQSGRRIIFHYRHAPYMQNWDAVDQYGVYEGTYKDDSVTTQTALQMSAAQYLNSVSQPTMTIALSAPDLYAIDPEANWDEELFVGAPVTVIDEVLGLEEVCVVTKIDKQDLTQPHNIDTLTLNNVHLTAQKLMAQLQKTHQQVIKYQQGQTVETPYTTAGSSTSSSPAVMNFYIRDATTLTHSTRVTIEAPGAFTVDVDGHTSVLSGPGGGVQEVDVLAYLTKSHNGQPTPGVHTVTVHTS